MVTKLGFIFSTTLFFLFIVQVSAGIGSTLVSGFDVSFTAPTDTVSFFLGFFSNFIIFFQLMTISSTFFIFGTVIVTAYIVSLLYIAIEVARGI